MTKITTKTCPECLAEHQRPQSEFCSAAHQKAWNNRKNSRGAPAVALLMAWAAGRGGGGREGNPLSRQAMRELTRMARDYIEADKNAVDENGNPRPRMDPLTYAERLMANGAMYSDRKSAKRR